MWFFFLFVHIFRSCSRDDLNALSIKWEVVTTTESSKPTVPAASSSRAADGANALDADDASETVQVRDSADELLNADDDSRMTEMSASRDFGEHPTSFGAVDENSQAALADDLVGFLSASSDEEDD